jgi:Ca-activated chloride channel family protein
MKRTLLLLWLATGALHAHANDAWDSLWRSADQRGDQLLQQGNAAAAAHTYRDARRRAYAELQARNYADAARDFARFDDSDSLYNRGNALAQTGQLQDAIKAYDAALKRDPNNRDARHNRDLVAKALQQNPPPPPKSGAGCKSPKNDQPQDQRGDDKQDQKGADKQDQTGKQGNDQKPSQANKSGGQNPPGKNQQAQAGQDKPAQNAAGNAQQEKDSTAQARQDGNDAAQSLGKTPPGHDAPTASAPTEQQLAQEQWLRRIPDDPGGLLRRKFMIEHMLRKQGDQP